MAVEVLCTPAAQADFVGAVVEHIGVALPASYLARGRVVGLREGGDLAGGFALIEQGPFRSLEQLPEGARGEIAWRLLTRCSRLVEVNGLFLTPQAKPRAAELWHALARELLASRASHLVFSYATSASGLARLYALLAPQLLYAGPVRALDGMTGPPSSASSSPSSAVRSRR